MKLRQRPKVMFVTESWVNGSGPFETLYSDYRSYFESEGWEVVVADNKWNYLPFGGNTMWDYPRGFGRLGLVRMNNLIVNRRARAAARRWKPNLVVITKGENISEETVCYFRKNGAIVFNWNHDNPFKPGNTSIEHLQSIRWFHKYFCLGGFIIPALRALGCEGAHNLPCFYNETRLGPPILGSDLMERKGIVFVGLGNYRRAQALRPLVPLGLEVWGDWKLAADDPLYPALRGRYLGGPEYSAVLRRSRIVINVFNEQCIGLHNARVFEATGCGALLVTEGSEDVDKRLFLAGKEILSFSNPEDICSIIRPIIANAAAYEEMRRGGFLRTQRDHLLRNRLARMQAIYSEQRCLVV